MLNVVAVGNVGSDPEVRDAGKTRVLNFRMASNSREKVGGEYQDVATWVNVSLFGERVDKLAEFIVKGKQVSVRGSLSERKYEKDGVQRTSLELRADDLQLLGSKSDGGSVGTTKAKPTTTFDDDGIGF